MRNGNGVSAMLQVRFSEFAKDDSGATAIEYALIAGIVSIAIVAALTQVSGSLKSTFTNVHTQLDTYGQ